MMGLKTSPLWRVCKICRDLYKDHRGFAALLRSQARRYDLKVGSWGRQMARRRRPEPKAKMRGA
jgi:hypothetical protein